MKSDWEKNKAGHDIYWGQLHNWMIENSSKYSDLKEEFLALNNFEMKGIALSNLIPCKQSKRKF